MEGRRWVSCAFCGQWIERDGPNGARRRGNAGWCAGCQRWWPDKHAQAVARARAEGVEQDLAARASKRARNSSALDSQGATDEHRVGEQPGGGGQSGADNLKASAKKPSSMKPLVVYGAEPSGNSQKVRLSSPAQGAAVSCRTP